MKDAPGRAKVAAIVGPTAAGKSEVAVVVAERLGAEIISVDSMQIYRGLDAGTAKPSAALRGRIPHHLIDVLEMDPFNPPLRAGEIITTGTLTRAFPVAAGETWTTTIEGIALEGVTLKFT